jgi:surface carbohydrate biosynthesis protein
MKFDFGLPHSTRVLFFGTTGLSILQNYINEVDYVVYENPRERINIWVALLALLIGRKSEVTYYKAFLKLFRPRFAITMEDNSLTFYSTKLLRPSCITLAVQNGIRGNLSNDRQSNFSSDLQESLTKGYGVDAIATLGASGTRFFESVLDAATTQITEVGSLRNNALKHSTESSNPRLIMVSTFPNLGENTSWDRNRWENDIAAYSCSSAITFESLYQIESKLAAICAQVALETNYPFVILGKRPKSQPAEYEYFSESLAQHQWAFHPAKDQASSYSFVKASDVIVSTDSTLGFELLSRGLKVALVTARMQTAGYPSLDEVTLKSLVGLPPRGPFWTDDSSDFEIKRVIQYAIGISSPQWEMEISTIKNKVVAFDPGNHRFCALLDRMGIKNSGPGYWKQSLIPRN